MKFITRQKIGWTFAIGLSVLIATKTKYDVLIRDISTKHDNNPNLVKALIKQESNFNEQAINSSAKEYSVGLGQINTRFWKYDKNFLLNPANNIEVMNVVIDDLKTRYTRVTDVIAAYNAGSVKLRRNGTYVNSLYVYRVYGTYLMLSAVNLGFL